MTKWKKNKRYYVWWFLHASLFLCHLKNKKRNIIKISSSKDRTNNNLKYWLTFDRYEWFEAKPLYSSKTSESLKVIKLKNKANKYKSKLHSELKSLFLFYFMKKYCELFIFFNTMSHNISCFLTCVNRSHFLNLR